LDIAALTQATVGAINWGLSAVNLNLVRRLFGRGSMLERTTYLVVGLAGLDLAWLTARFIAGGYQTPPARMPEAARMAREAGREARQVGQEIQEGMQRAGEEFQRGYQRPEMRP